MPGRRSAGIDVSGTICAGIICAGIICAGISRAFVVRRWIAGAASICRVGGSRPLRTVVILRVLLVRPLLILVWPLLRLVLPLWILIRPLLILVWPLLISVLSLVLGSVRSGLELGIAELTHRRATIEAALGGS